jgi:tRNA G37 N-methylase Trm5
MKIISAAKKHLGFFLLDKFSKLRTKVLGRHAQAILYDTKQGRFLVNVRDMAIGNSLGFSGEHEKKELNRLREVIEPEYNLAIIGAHVGTLAIPLSEEANQISAYEANPENYNLLKDNININGANNIDAYNCAIGDSNKKKR